LNEKGNESRVEEISCLYSTASTGPNKVMLTIFTLVAEYFLQPPRTLYAYYILLGILNLNFE